MARVRTEEQRLRANAWQREYRLRNLERIRAYQTTDEYRTRNAARARRDWAENRNGLREKTNARSQIYKQSNREKVRVARQPRDMRVRMARHGPQIGEWVAKARSDQGDRCYLCGDPLGSGKDVVVDHDHACCPATFSCSLCRRGLACQRCNRLIGMANDDPNLLHRIANALDVVLDATRMRIATNATQQLSLDVVGKEDDSDGHSR